VHTPSQVQDMEQCSNAVAILVPDEEGRLLILWHSKYRFWTVPLGKIEPGEGGLGAAHREAFEELGIVSEHVDLIDTIYKPIEVDDYSDITIALCRVSSYTGTIVNREPDKHDQLRFVHVHELHSLKPVSFPTSVIAERFGSRSTIRSANRRW
jgi:8-oxo-dGTP pyrophosphatase MutT (NUDIX family)